MSVSSLAIPRHKSGAIWAMKFSKDGRYLAAGGQDKIVRVWAVIGSADERSAHEMDEDAAGVDSGSVYTEGRGVRLNAPVFRSEPTREYSGHTADILDLSWSKVSMKNYYFSCQHLMGCPNAAVEQLSIIIIHGQDRSAVARLKRGVSLLFPT